VVEVIAFAAERLMEIEVGALARAAHGGTSPAPPGADMSELLPYGRTPVGSEPVCLQIFH
jgi:hypothetical protein